MCITVYCFIVLPRQLLLQVFHVQVTLLVVRCLGLHKLVQAAQVVQLTTQTQDRWFSAQTGGSAHRQVVHQHRQVVHRTDRWFTAQTGGSACPLCGRTCVLLMSSSSRLVTSACLSNSAWASWSSSSACKPEAI